MRTPLVVNAQPSPLAEAFSKFSGQILSAPTPEERELKAAMTQMYTQKAAEGQMQSEAMQGLPGNIASLFAPHTGSGVPVEEFIGPPPESGLPPEDPNARAARMSTGLASLFGQVGKDNAAAIRAGLATGEAYGSPDSMRRAMVLQGKSIDQNFSPTLDEGNRIAARNQELKPLTESEVKGGLIRDNFDNLQDLDINQQKVIGALPSKGMSVTMPDGTTIEMGGTSLPGGAPTNKTLSDMQGKANSGRELEGVFNVYENMLNGLPEEAFGSAGASQQFLSNTLMQGANMATALQKMGYNVGPNVDGATALNLAMNDARTDAAKMGLSPEMSERLFPQKRQVDALEGAYNLMLYKAAAGLAGQEGRGLTNADIERVATAMPSPLGWTGSKQKSIDSIALGRQLLGISKAVNTMQPLPAVGAPVGTAPPGAPPPAAAPAVQGGLPAGYTPERAITEARAAITARKSRKAVLERLQSYGITPPPDL